MEIQAQRDRGLRPDLLALCREAAGLTQGALAQHMTKRSGEVVSQGYVSRVESGALVPTPDRISLFAAALEVTTGALTDKDARIWALGEGCDYQRKRASTSVKAMRRLHASLNLIRLAIERNSLTGHSGSLFAVPRTAIEGMTSAQDVARALRVQLGVPVGPIRSVIALAEQAGAWVVNLPMGEREVDAASLHPNGGVPLFAVNMDAPADRLRFTLAHELGHAVSAVAAGKEERAADEFAAELLLPAREIVTDLRAQPITLQRLREIKRHWRVSAAAIARRSHDLGVMNDRAYRSLVIEMSSLGWRTGEPDPLEHERPTTVPTLIGAALERFGSVEAVADVGGMTPVKFREWFSATTDLSRI